MYFLTNKIKLLFILLFPLLFYCNVNIFANDSSITPAIGISHQINDYLGFNGNMIAAGNNPWENKNLLETLKCSNVSIFRYPGGTLGNYWDMSLGWIDPNAALNDMPGWIGKLKNSKDRYTLKDLAIACSKSTKITPFFVANMLTKNCKDFINNLKEAKSDGIPVKYIELGNEFFYPPSVNPSYESSFKNGYKYGEVSKQWIKKIKEVFPNAQIGIVANLNTASNVESRRKSWNETMMKNNVKADALIVHFYFDSGVTPSDGKSSSPFWGTKNQQVQQYNNLKNSDCLASMLQRPAKVWEQYLNYTPYLKSSKKNIWITEFNINDTTGPTRETWAHGLLIANTLNVFLKDRRITHILMHNFFSGPEYSAVFSNSNFFSGLLVKDLAPQTNFQTTTYDLTATGHVIQLFATAMKNMNKATQLKINDSSFGWLFSNNQNEKKGIIVNNSSSSIKLDLSKTLNENSVYLQFNANPLSYPTSIQTPGKTGDIIKTLDIPGYSITLILGDK
jgi:hypothetical protein